MILTHGKCCRPVSGVVVRRVDDHVVAHQRIVLMDSEEHMFIAAFVGLIRTIPTIAVGTVCEPTRINCTVIHSRHV